MLLASSSLPQPLNLTLGIPFCHGYWSHCTITGRCGDNDDDAIQLLIGS